MLYILLLARIAAPLTNEHVITLSFPLAKERVRKTHTEATSKLTSSHHTTTLLDYV